MAAAPIRRDDSTTTRTSTGRASRARPRTGRTRTGTRSLGRETHVVLLEHAVGAIARAHERARRRPRGSRSRSPTADSARTPAASRSARPADGSASAAGTGRTSRCRPRRACKSSSAAEDLVVGLAEAEHEARLREHVRARWRFACVEHRQRLRVARARVAHSVREPLRRSRDSARTRRRRSRRRSRRRASLPAKSGVSASTTVCGTARLDRAHAVGVVLRAAVRQIVAIDRRQHDVLEDS